MNNSGDLLAQSSEDTALSMGELLELKRWNTPTIYNGWEQLTRADSARDAFNIEPTTDFMPELGPMVGYAATVVIEPSNRAHLEGSDQRWRDYRRYIATCRKPTIVVIQDLDSPGVIGSFWGEVTSSMHRALGCVGTITDGAIRDWDEMYSVGFKALARRLCVGHGFACPVRWDCAVEVFGRSVAPGQLVHADKHGFLAVPPDDEAGLLDAARFLDSSECRTLLAATHPRIGLQLSAMLDEMEEAWDAFSREKSAEFGRRREQ